MTGSDPATATPVLGAPELESILSVAAGGLMTAAADGTILWANDIAASLCAPDADPISGSLLGGIASDLDRLRLVCQREGRATSGVLTIDSVPLECTVFPAEGRTVIAVRDVTTQIIDISAQVAAEEARQAAENQVLQSERRYRLLAENMADLVVLTRAGSTSWVSPSTREVLGWEVTDLIGADPLTFVHPEDLAAARVARSEMSVDGITRKMRLRLANAGGDYLWFDARLSKAADGEAPGDVLIALRDITDQVRAEEAAQQAMFDLSFRSTHDTLTGLLNRRALLSALDRLLAEGRAAGQGTAILYCDLDNLKEINDGVSHEAGDAILIQLADSLQRTLRAQDLVGRVGGDEFVVVLRDVPDSDRAQSISEKIRDRASAGLTSLVGLRVPSGVSIGLRLDDGRSSATQLLRDADAALHEAKATGRNQIVLYDEDLRKRLEWLRSARTELAQAVEDDEIHAWFQPVVDLASRKVVGFEALARWVRPEGVMDAGEWIDAVTDTQIMSRIGDTVVTEAIEWLGSLDESQWVAVNASAREISNPGFVGSLARMLDESGIEPHRLIVEVTESVVMDRQVVRKQLDALVSRGVRISFDDFGTGYASLTHLNSLPVSGLKLDRSFTASLEDDRVDSLALVRGIAGLADQLGLDGVAEGIETDTQAEMLAAAGWRLGQGYLFGRAAAPTV